MAARIPLRLLIKSWSVVTAGELTRKDINTIFVYLNIRNMSKTNVHMEVPRELNGRIKQLAASEEARTGKRSLIKDKYLECLEAGVAWKESQERTPKIDI